MRDAHASELQLIALEKRHGVAIADALDCEVRFAPPADDGSIEGYAVKFGVVDSYRTSFDQRAFAWDGRSLPLLWSHDPSQVVGSVRSVAVDADGLRIKGRLNLDVAKAREVRALLTAGDIGGLSIGFRRLKDESRAGGTRHITSAQLIEVSFVAVPSVPGSNVTSIRAYRSDPALSAFTAALRRTTAAIGKRK